MTRSARKGLQPLRSVKFEGSAATRGAKQAQALATSARGDQRKGEAKLQTSQSTRRFDDLAILYHNTRDYVWRSTHDFIAEVISEISSLLTRDLQSLSLPAVLGKVLWLRFLDGFESYSAHPSFQ